MRLRFFALILLGASAFAVAACGGTNESAEPERGGAGSNGAAVAITRGDQIAGSYRAEGTNPPPSSQNIKYVGDVVVSSVADETSVSVSWVIGSDRWARVGTITEEGELFVTFTGAFAGSGTWVLRADGNLYGIWQADGFEDTGTEVWLRNEDSA